MSYFVYIIECEDSSLYTGVSHDVDKRFAKHVAGKGASYTRSHRPLRVAYREEMADKSSALKREIEIKKLTHDAKVKLCLK